jgi:hypothetical protein
VAKLKQIAIEPPNGEHPAVLWGLCRNGSLWMQPLGSGRWLRVDAPPAPMPIPARRNRAAAKRAAAAAIELPAGMRVTGGAAE